MGGRTNSRLALMLKLLLGAALLLLVLRAVDFSAVRALRFAPGWLVPAFFISLLIIVLRAIRWKSVLASYFSHEIPFRDALPILFIGQLFGFATPSRAGDFIRASYLRKSIGLKKGVLSVALETLMDLTVMAVLSLFAVLVFQEKIVSSFEGILPSWALPLAGGIALLAAAAGAAVWLGLPLPGKADSYASRLKQALRTLLKSLSPAALLYQLGLTAVKWTLAALVTYLCAMSLGLRVPFIPFMLMVTLQSILLLLPVTVFGLGVREWTSYVLYPTIGIPADLAIPVAWLAILFVAIVPALIGAVAYFAYRGTIREDN